MAIFNLCLIYLLFIGFGSCNSPSPANGKRRFSENENQEKASKKDFKFLKKPSRVYQIPAPPGFYREKADSQSFGYFLRNLELDTINNYIYSYDGSIISKGAYHNSIIKIDIGDKDLQQCADAVMRLRAEYLYGLKLYKKIHFNFLSDGQPRYFVDFAKGDYRYKTFRKYMDYIFSYANTSSLLGELQKVSNIAEMQIGDVFIQKGKPIGHAVIVIDMATEEKTGKKVFMIAQSYMPAQSIHILRNMNDTELDPWYPVNFEDPLELPSWNFIKGDLRRFR